MCSVRCSEENNKRTCVGEHSYVIFVYAKSFCVWVLKLRQAETQFLHSDKLLINLYLTWTAWRSTLFKYSALHLHAGSLTSTWAVLGTHKFLNSVYGNAKCERQLFTSWCINSECTNVFAQAYFACFSREWLCCIFVRLERWPNALTSLLFKWCVRWRA